MASDAVSETEVEMVDGASDGDQKKLDVHALAAQRAESILGNIQSVVTYAIDDRPPWYSTILLACQHFLTDIGGNVSAMLIIAPAFCVQGNLDIVSKLISTTFVVAGIQTFIQSTLGSRLPIVQGPSFAYIIPMISMTRLRGECPAVSNGNATVNVTEDDVEDEFRNRMEEVSGALLIASLFEIVVGLTGIIGFLLRFIGPLTITPTIGILGLSLFSVAGEYAGRHWGISALTVILIGLFSQYLERFDVPCLSWSPKSGCKVSRFPLFKVFPVLLAIIISWVFCSILTVAGVFPEEEGQVGYYARTDLGMDRLKRSPWVYFPYPGQFGPPRVTASGVLGMIAGCVASIIESIGDYYACAKLSGAPAPPPHAVNRGIGVEGFGGIVAALWGNGMGSTSLSQNIGTIGITKVGSRLVIQVLCLVSIFFGIFLKGTAFLATIPDPVLGGVMAVTFGLIASVGMSNLQYVNLNSTRNLFIIGVSFFIGLAVPPYINSHTDQINTGSETFDEILVIILGTGMFVGGATGFFLDNTIPGTVEERGLVKFRELQGMVDDVECGNDMNIGDELRYETTRLVNKCYDFPFGMASVRTWRWTTYAPFCPNFSGYNLKYCRGQEPHQQRDCGQNDIMYAHGITHL